MARAKNQGNGKHDKLDEAITALIQARACWFRVKRLPKDKLPNRSGGWPSMSG